MRVSLAAILLCGAPEALMQRPLVNRRHLAPLLIMLTTAASIAACAPWELGDGDDHDGLGPGSVVLSNSPPPAISGGTMLVARDGRTVVAADPDRDRVWIVDLDTQKLVAEVALEAGDEPGRVVEDAAGRFHVALRRGGAIVTVDAAGKIADRRDVCPSPRGIAFDEPAGALHVACLGGELVTLPADGGAATRTLRLQRDLRDVVIDGDRLLVSLFRSAEVLTVDAQGVVTERFAQPAFQMFGQLFEPAVAWRMVGLPTGGAVMVHQRAMTTPVVIEDDGYASGGCDNSIVHGAVSTVGTAALQGTSGIASAAIPFSVLPVDLAVSAGGDKLALVAAGTGEVILTSPSLTAGNDFEGEGMCNDGEQRLPVPGEPTAVAFAGDRVVVQTREPASIVVLNGATIALPGESRVDSGHEMFHHNPGGISSLACASCHPEGGQDGRTWNFDPIGPRRTQSLEGGILGTAPFHWDGDMTGLETIMSEVFERRMGGMHQSPRRVNAFARWIDHLPALPASEVMDPAAAERGEALFNDATVACASCHSGSALTNNQSHDVGTGKAFQVPSLLGVASRAPFMHDGCAPTLKDRFSGYCGGGEQHGKTAHLSDAQIDDLVAYLESL